jgi:hypothetical protein
MHPTFPASRLCKPSDDDDSHSRLDCSPDTSIKCARPGRTRPRRGPAGPDRARRRHLRWARWAPACSCTRAGPGQARSFPHTRHLPLHSRLGQSAAFRFSHSLRASNPSNASRPFINPSSSSRNPSILFGAFCSSTNCTLLALQTASPHTTAQDSLDLADQP